MPPALRRTSCSAAAASQGVLSTSAPMLVPQWPNDRWSLDSVADQFIDGPSPVESKITVHLRGRLEHGAGGRVMNKVLVSSLALLSALAVFDVAKADEPPAKPEERTCRRRAGAGRSGPAAGQQLVGRAGRWLQTASAP